MAKAKPICRRCDQPHWGYEKCQVKENQKGNVSIHNTVPNLPDGYRPWKDVLSNDVVRYGDMVVQKSEFQMKPHGGTVKGA